MLKRIERLFNSMNLLPLNLQRRQLYRQYKHTPLGVYLSCEIPSAATNIENCEFLVLDFETSGLDVSCDQLVSLGYTLIRQKRVVMAQNHYDLIRQQQVTDKSAVTIHQITDTSLERGVELKTAFDSLINALAGRVLVAHHAAIEAGFINAICKKFYGCELPLRIVDTMKIEKNNRLRRHQHIKKNELRLFNLRNEYGLPRYKAHNALEDAIATAELLLVQISNQCGTAVCRLKELL